MISFLLHISFLLQAPLIISAADNNQPYNPTDQIRLACGSSSNSYSFDGRYWISDGRTTFSKDFNISNISVAARATEQNPSFDIVPYMTARIILSRFSYTFFTVSTGQKFLRLYFYPATYSGNFYGNQSFFSVTVNHYTLLSNFSAFRAVSSQVPQVAYLVKEFIINVQETQLLNVTFWPSANSFAFVNGIEIISTPDKLYMDYGYPLQLVNIQNILFEFDQNKTAFETLYRLNVGGDPVFVMEDTGMYREWLQDDYFIFGMDTGQSVRNNTIPLKYSSQTPNYSAPGIVYTTARVMGSMSLRFNLTWIFSVDSGFYYLLRLHFCEFMPYIFNATNQRVFSIFINNRNAETEFDVIAWTGGTGIPIFKDYVVFVSNPFPGEQRKQDLFLALHPSVWAQPMYYDAILNGLEIFKLNGSDGNLAVSKELEPNSTSPEKKKKKNRGRIGLVFAVTGGLVGIGATILMLINWRRREKKDFDRKRATNSKSTDIGGSSSSVRSDLCRRFSLEEIKSASTNFDATCVIGTGGFGNVYKGYIDNNLTAVAIKRLNPSSSQGAREFRTEIEMLSNLRHRHLVSLIGYCDEKGEMILVYDYMTNGTLRDHLYRTENPPLPWKQRLHICIGAAKGLHYLHNGATHNIIHRDVKSTNILLDEKWVAKVSDFGLSKLGPADEIYGHVSTQVKGSFGYVDPEYYKRQQLTDKSDVYSFGVVLFEVLCARPAVVPSLPREQANLGDWARRCYTNGTVDQIVDPNVKDQIDPECLMTYSKIAINCLKEEGMKRPAMSDIIWSLEFVLHLQESADNIEGDRRPTFFPLILRGQGGEEEITSARDDTETISNSGRGNMGMADEFKAQISSECKCDSLFTEILDPKGR